MINIKKISSIALISVLVASCQNMDVKQQYPQTIRDQRDESFGKITGSEGIVLGGKKRRSEAVGITVNSFLWRASLEAASNLPILIVDPFSGVITTDWYKVHNDSKEKFKLNIVISSDVIRADAVKVSVFKQIHGKSGWVDDGINNTMSIEIENKILTRARQLKIAAQ